MTPTDRAPASPGSARIDATLAARLNLADFLNAVPVLRELAVLNAGETSLQEVELVVSAEPAFLLERCWRIDALAAGERLRIDDLDLRLDGTLFSRLTEAERATVEFSLRRRGDTSVVLASHRTEVELLPRHQWGGLAGLPEMVAAFVQPNDPAVDRLLKRAAEVLRQAGRGSDLDGYRQGSRRAWELLSALWSALGGLGLDYALPPASFEHRGQKVRSPSQVVEAGLATCLDLALLFCAAAEQAGLHPLLVFTEGHAFAGAWLQPEEFSSCVVDDPTALRKRVRLKELVLFETTLLTQRPLPPFSHAIERALQQVAEDRGQAFELAVDVRRARLQRIKPLASAEAALASALPSSEATVAEPGFEAAPDGPDDRPATDEPLPETPQDRLTRWQRKLLDLSLRNNLLSFKAGKKSLPLDAPEASRLEDLLASGQAVKLLPRPGLMEGADPRSQALHESREREDLRRQHALEALERKEVFVGLPAPELEARLVELYRSARATLQEGGSNTLYLALGFLSWTRGDREGRRFKAPLLLVPVLLERKSVRSGFSLRLHDDEPRFNPTLIEMLRQDFRLHLGLHDGELPRDEAGLDIAGVWRQVSAAIKEVPGWEVVEDVVLSTFSFAKYLMWKDLTERTGQLKHNPVVRHLIETPRESYAGAVAFPEPQRLDQELAPRETFCPLPADSSQLSAVVAASRGKDFVLFGPPGTGKSQTISNLIAQCLAEGKRVLFVSEKMAALDVVWRRLRDVGLGDFCLELHSSKARKAEVLAQLRRAWEAGGSADAEAWQAEAERLAALRAQLNGHVERLHRRHANGLSVHEALSRVVAGPEVPAQHLGWPSPDSHDAVGLARLREVVDLLEVNAEAAGSAALAAPGLQAVGRADWSPTWQAGLLEAARALQASAQAAEAAGAAWLQQLDLPTWPLQAPVRAGLRALATALPQAAGHDWRFVLRPDAAALVEGLRQGHALLLARQAVLQQLPPPWEPAVQERMRQGLDLLARRQALVGQLGPAWSAALVEELARGVAALAAHAALHRQLSLPYGHAAGGLDARQLQRDWQRAQQAVWPLGWWRRRRLSRQLQAAAGGAGEPDLAGDIERLVKMRALQTEVESLDTLALRTGRLWAGMATSLEAARAALAYQAAAARALAGQPWDETGLEPLAEGLCGPALGEDLRRLRELRAIDAELAALQPLLAGAAGEVWAGWRTEAPAAAAALRLHRALQAVQAGQAWQDEGLAPVEAGRCGAAAAATLQHLRELSALQRRLDGLAPLAAAVPTVWQGASTPVDALAAALAFQAAVAEGLAGLATSAQAATAVRRSLEQRLGDAGVLLQAAGPLAAAARGWLDALAALEAAWHRYAELAEMPAASRQAFEWQPPAALSELAAALLASAGKLPLWCAWRAASRQAASLGLGALVQAAEQGRLLPGTLRHAFETDYSRWWLNAVVDADEGLRSFVSAVHEKRIRDFQALDERFTRLTQEWVRARLCAALPAPDSVGKNTDWGLLRYEMQKKTRHLPLRELMRRAPQAVLSLTPCLLMSPLSIAQYLSADTANFDLVVFDEASQIPVWDAIGAIARGKQVVMVGDPKQLPPTRFFDRAEADDEADADVEADLESILDECIGANLPTMKLAWHYRSRHESLIAFSNRHYYGNELVTFPSPVTEDRAVSLHHVADGLYEKGGSRTNRPEAVALVRELVGRLKSPAFRESGMTVGVVTFNAEQQTLIEDLLDEERRQDPAIEACFAEDRLEPVFVKNLESVQGDERDIMYFSLTYGPGAGGAVSMNFGPMNRQGGERRLNVAITRARHELRVFSSLRPEQMDLSRTASAGVRDLKHFMEFAERGAAAFGEPVPAAGHPADGLFESVVASALASRGWQVRRQVGVSAFKVDLAVVDPQRPGHYLAAIECDGLTYRRAATARDRDKLREQVLRGLGWRLLRLWSTDWWIDPQGTLQRLDGELQALRQPAGAALPA
ncbi:DUF4011 domain-containing protein [Eleftheria terrae]|uniref:DUF4011 domain-containing protein n=1 Tax=Eleftheria terrae TaxID=1597781 RepID=UPI00263B9991|nr:DUF4011 domain-containing protein [Eleftheria terrae]WKB54977.1 DUF4011 domain-containing protein [Eleftheria terrae]